MPDDAKLAGCVRCPRLVALRHTVREQYPAYHAAPVPAWGGRRSRLLIVGLAPGMHGANRTGRPFTGDASGRFLFESLAAAGFATHADANKARLLGARITNAIKCLPPENRPLPDELRNCMDFLRQEIAQLTGRRPRRPRVILCLGRISHDAVGAALDRRLVPFRHGQQAALGERLWLFDSYHPSRQNTNTGRLTRPMLDTVIEAVKTTLAA